MTVEFVRNKTDSGVCLMCTEDIIPLAEVPLEQQTLRKKAFYVKVPEGFIGVHSSPNGPVLFINEKKFPFSDLRWSVSVMEGERTNVAKLTGLDGETFEIEY